MLMMGLGLNKMNKIPSSGIDKTALVQSLGGILYYDALRADGSGLPSNSPFTDPWVDLINSYDGDLTNFAETTASGWDASDTSDPFLKFAGDNDYILTGLTAANFPSGSFSFFSKFKTGTVDENNRGIIAIDQSNALQGFLKLIKTSTKYMELRISNSTGSSAALTSDNTLTDNTAYTVVITYNGTSKEYKMYINGIFQTSTVTISGTRGTPDSTNLIFGAYYSNHSRTGYWQEGVRSLVLFNTELSQTNINNLILNGI